MAVEFGSSQSYIMENFRTIWGRSVKKNQREFFPKILRVHIPMVVPGTILEMFIALRIAEWLGCDPSSAVENWVDALLASPDSARMTDREILSAIMDKMK